MSCRSAAALCALLAFAVSAARAVDIVAHRGASHDAPENTLASQKPAWEQGADAVEHDIHLTGRRMFVEIKTGQEIVPERQRILAATGATERNITIVSFHYEALQAVREKLSRLPTQYLVGYQPPGPKKTGVKKIKAAGLQLHVWTVDDPDVARHWAALDAQSITTNRPAFLCEHLQR